MFVIPHPPCYNHPMNDDLFTNVPGPARGVVLRAWQQLPPDVRGDLQLWLPYALRDVGSSRELFGFITDNYRHAFDRSELTVAIVGPANAGKSTLYNQFTVRRDDRAATSPVPGTTLENQATREGLFTVVDTPGAATAGPAGEDARTTAFTAARTADLLVIVFDAAQGIRPSDKQLFDALVGLGRPYVVVLNKMDLIETKDVDAVLDAAAATLGMDRAHIIPISALEGDNLGKLVLAVVQAHPRLLTLIATALPEYRSRLAWQRIIAAASAAASVALIPLPLADMVPLLGIQTGLVLTIARIYGYSVTLARARELIVAFGVGFLARSVYRQLTKFLGAPGWIVSAAVAASATVAIGYSTTLWFERGKRPSREEMSKVMTDVGGYLRDALMSLRLSKPDGASVKTQVQQALKEMPSAVAGAPE